jgi:hypothetical protein
MSWMRILAELEFNFTLHCHVLQQTPSHPLGKIAKCNAESKF